jgi:glycosyltransferase involved in cell wall biosynthesis
VRVVLDGRYIQDHFPGIARYTYNLARALGTTVGGELTLLVDPVAPNRHYDLGALARTTGLRLRPGPAGVFRPVALIQVSWLLRHLCADVYHAPYYLLPPALPCRSVVTIFDLTSETLHGFLPGGRLRGVYRSGFRAATVRAWRTATRAIVPSRATAAALVARYPAAAPKLAIVPLGVDAHFAPADRPAVESVRSRYNLPDRFVLHLGLNKPHKNLARLVAAFERAALDPDVSLVLAGPRDRRYPTGPDLASGPGLAGRVLAPGPIAAADLPGLYGAATVFAFPSLDEGFGLPVLEAMACGAPVVCADRGALPEVVGEAALLVDPIDEGALAAALHRLLSVPAERDRLRAAGLARAARFRWEAAAAATWQVYREAWSGR